MSSSRAKRFALPSSVPDNRPHKKAKIEPVDIDTPTPKSLNEQNGAIAGVAENEKKKKRVSKAAPIKTLFTPWKPSLPPLPPFNPAWGRKPMPGPDGPRSYPDQPPARTSNAQTVPSLWEDRKSRLKKGDQFIKSLQKDEDVSDEAPILDQKENLVLQLIDMRPKNRKDQTPRRIPAYYVYENGLPKDWNNKQTIKALNDRRQQAIDRVTMETSWTNYEREYLASIFREFPDASILETTERFNARFKDQDFPKTTAFGWDQMSTGRTIESVRHEYLTYKHKYDQGEAPKKKELADKPLVAKGTGKPAIKNQMDKFGRKDKNLDHDDSDDSDTEESATAHKKPATRKRKGNVKANEPNDGTSAPSKQSKLSDGDEELLELAGYNESGEVINPYTPPSPSESSERTQSTTPEPQQLPASGHAGKLPYSPVESDSEGSEFVATPMIKQIAAEKTQVKGNRIPNAQEQPDHITKIQPQSEADDSGVEYNSESEDDDELL